MRGGFNKIVRNITASAASKSEFEKVRDCVDKEVLEAD